MPTAFKFGKKAARRSRKTLALSNYLHMGAMAYPPVQAWERPIDLGMLGNDSVGDCTIAGFYHLRMIQRSVAQAGNPLVVSTEQALADYSTITGYNPNDPSTDQGANCIDVLNYYRSKGVIPGYVSLDQNNVDQIQAANYIFGGLYIGFQVPQSTVDELNAGIDPTFNFVANDKPSGEGHCVDPCGHGRAGYAFASWGKYYRASWDYWMAWVDEAYAVVAPDWIKASGVSPSALDLNGLLADMAQV